MPLETQDAHDASPLGEDQALHRHAARGIPQGPDPVDGSRVPLSPNEGGQAYPSASREAPMPHDRDESRDDMSGPIEASTVLAKADLDAGRQDTSRAVEADETYRKQKQSAEPASTSAGDPGGSNGSGRR